MARGRIYKSEVQQARTALLAQGRHPSIDAVRVALGNTGSRTTIHRLLKELEADERAAPAHEPAALDEPLQALVTQLAETLRHDAQMRIAEGAAEAATAIADAEAARDAAMAAADAATATIESQRVQLDRLQASLAAAEARLAEQATALTQGAARLAGLQDQLTERDVRLAGVETHLGEAIAALEDMSTSAQRERMSAAARADAERAALTAKLTDAQQETARLRDALHAATRAADNFQAAEQNALAALAQAEERERGAHARLAEAQARAAQADIERTQLAERLAGTAAQLAEQARAHEADLVQRQASIRYLQQALDVSQAHGAQLLSIQTALSTLTAAPTDASALRG